MNKFLLIMIIAIFPARGKGLTYYKHDLPKSYLKTFRPDSYDRRLSYMEFDVHGKAGDSALIEVYKNGYGYRLPFDEEKLYDTLVNLASGGYNKLRIAPSIDDSTYAYEYVIAFTPLSSGMRLALQDKPDESYKKWQCRHITGISDILTDKSGMIRASKLPLSVRAFFSDIRKAPPSLFDKKLIAARYDSSARFPGIMVVKDMNCDTLPDVLIGRDLYINNGDFRFSKKNLISGIKARVFLAVPITDCGDPFRLLAFCGNDSMITRIELYGGNTYRDMKHISGMSFESPVPHAFNIKSAGISSAEFSFHHFSPYDSTLDVCIYEFRGEQKSLSLKDRMKYKTDGHVSVSRNYDMHNGLTSQEGYVLPAGGTVCYGKDSTYEDKYRGLYYSDGIFHEYEDLIGTQPLFRDLETDIVRYELTSNSLLKKVPGLQGNIISGVRRIDMNGNSTEDAYLYSGCAVHPDQVRVDDKIIFHTTGIALHDAAAADMNNDGNPDLIGVGDSCFVIYANTGRHEGRVARVPWNGKKESVAARIHASRGHIIYGLLCMFSDISEFSSDSSDRAFLQGYEDSKEKRFRIIDPDKQPAKSEKNVPTEFIAMPNPFREEVILKFSSDDLPGEMKIRVIDSEGRKIKEMAHYEPGKTASVKWDGRDAAGNPSGVGVYFIMIELKGNVYNHKIIKGNGDEN